MFEFDSSLLGVGRSGVELDWSLLGIGGSWVELEFQQLSARVAGGFEGSNEEGQCQLFGNECQETVAGNWQGLYFPYKLDVPV